MCFLNTSFKGNDSTLISREIAMLFLNASFKGSDNKNINSFLLHTYFKGKSNPFLACFFEGKWQYFSCTLLLREMTIMYFLLHTSFNNWLYMYIYFSCTLISRVMAIHFSLTCFKENGNTFLAYLYQGKWQYIVCTFISREKAIYFLQTYFKGNGNIFLAYLFQGKWQSFPCTCTHFKGKW